MLKLRFDRGIKTKSCTNRFFLALEAAFFHSYNLQFHFVVVVLMEVINSQYSNYMHDD